MFLNGGILQHAGFYARGQHALTVSDWNFHVDKGKRLVRQRDKVFTLDHGQQVEHVGIQYVPGTNLLFDHVEAGLFDIHSGTPGGMLTDSIKFYPAAPSVAPQQRRIHCAKSSK